MIFLFTFYTYLCGFINCVWVATTKTYKYKYICLFYPFYYI